jgi:hypothetical protein
MEVSATPFFCELRPIKMKSEMNNTPEIKVYIGQEASLRL